MIKNGKKQNVPAESRTLLVPSWKFPTLWLACYSSDCNGRTTWARAKKIMTFLKLILLMRRDWPIILGRDYERRFQRYLFCSYYRHRVTSYYINRGHLY
jgi:hypothetical protein